jgi:uncharacterized membrane protein
MSVHTERYFKIINSNVYNVNDFTSRALGKIGAVALFRTALAYTLGYEVKEIQKEIHEEDRG